MTGFNHTLAGTVIALTIREPLLIAPIAFLSHFAMDALPHFGRHPKLVPYNTYFKKYLIGEAFLSVSFLALAIILSPEDRLILSWGAAWATLPDFIWLLENKSPKWLKWFFIFHKHIQWGEHVKGWIYELIALITLTSLLFLLT